MIAGFRNSVKRNLSYSIAYQATAILVPFVTAPYVSRVLGAEELGVYSYSYSVASTFLLFTMLGMVNHGNRATASTHRDAESLGEVFINNYIIQVVCGLIVLSLYLAYCCFVASKSPIALVQGFVVLSGILDITWFFSGLEEFRLVAIRGAVCKTAGAIAIFLFVKSPSDTWIYALITALTLVFSQIIMWPFLRSIIKPCKPSWRMVRQNVKPILVLFIPVLSYSIYMLIDKVQIGLLADITQVAYYSNAEKIIIIPSSVVTALGAVMLPRATKMLSEKKPDKHIEYILISLSFVAIVQGFLCFGISSIAKTLAPWYFGDEYMESGVLLQFLIFAPLVSGVANVLRTQYLIPMRKDNVYVASTAAAAILNFLLNLLLIPGFQAGGAVASTLIAESSVLFIQVICVKRYISLRQMGSAVLPYLSIGFAIYVSVVLCNQFIYLDSVIEMIIDVVIGTIAYILLFAAVAKKRDDYAYSVIKKLLDRARLLYR